MQKTTTKDEYIFHYLEFGECDGFHQIFQLGNIVYFTYLVSSTSTVSIRNKEREGERVFHSKCQLMVVVKKLICESSL